MAVALAWRLARASMGAVVGMGAAALAGPAVMAAPAGVSLAAGMALVAHAARRRLGQGVEVRARKARVAGAPAPKPRHWTGTAVEAGAGVMLAATALPGAALVACGAAAFAGARGWTRVKTWGTRAGLLKPAAAARGEWAPPRTPSPARQPYREWDAPQREETPDLSRPAVPRDPPRETPADLERPAPAAGRMEQRAAPAPLPAALRPAPRRRSGPCSRGPQR